MSARDIWFSPAYASLNELVSTLLSAADATEDPRMARGEYLLLIPVP